MRRLGAVCPAVRWRPQSLLLGCRARMDRRPTRHGHGPFFSQATAGPSEELQAGSQRRATLTGHPDAPSARAWPVGRLRRGIRTSGIQCSYAVPQPNRKAYPIGSSLGPAPSPPRGRAGPLAALDISRGRLRGVRMHPVLRPAIASAAARRHRRCEASARELTRRVGDRRRGFAMPTPRSAAAIRLREGAFCSCNACSARVRRGCTASRRTMRWNLRLWSSHLGDGRDEQAVGSSPERSPRVRQPTHCGAPRRPLVYPFQEASR